MNGFGGSPSAPSGDTVFAQALTAGISTIQVPAAPVGVAGVYAEIELQGAGCGAGAAAGGAGGMTRWWRGWLRPGSQVTAVVGAKGAANAGGNGANGGSTSVAVTMSNGAAISFSAVGGTWGVSTNPYVATTSIAMLMAQACGSPIDGSGTIKEVGYNGASTTWTLITAQTSAWGAGTYRSMAHTAPGSSPPANSGAGGSYQASPVVRTDGADGGVWIRFSIPRGAR